MSMLALTLILSASAATAAVPQGEHAQLSARRAAAEARYAAETQACRDRFAVNACLEEARIRRNLSIKPIELREQELDAIERRQRSEAQKQRVAERQREFAQEQGKRQTEIVARAAAAASADAAAEAPATAASRTKPPEPQLHYRAAQKQQAVDAEAAQRRAEQARARVAEIKARQRDVAKRQSADAAQGKKPAAALPVPSAAEVASAASSAKR